MNADEDAAHEPPKEVPLHAQPEGEQHTGPMAHIIPVRLLLTVWGSLMLLTVVTVAATRIDLGSQGNLVIAMVIATVKAALVAVYFMHLRWDRSFHALIFLASLLFLALFMSLTLLDASEYEPAIELRSQQLQQ